MARIHHYAASFALDAAGSQNSSERGLRSCARRRRDGSAAGSSQWRIAACGPPQRSPDYLKLRTSSPSAADRRQEWISPAEAGFRTGRACRCSSARPRHSWDTIAKPVTHICSSSYDAPSDPLLREEAGLGAGRLSRGRSSDGARPAAQLTQGSALDARRASVSGWVALSVINRPEPWSSLLVAAAADRPNPLPFNC